MTMGNPQWALDPNGEGGQRFGSLNVASPPIPGLCGAGGDWDGGGG